MARGGSVPPHRALIWVDPPKVRLLDFLSRALCWNASRLRASRLGAFFFLFCCLSLAAGVFDPFVIRFPHRGITAVYVSFRGVRLHTDLELICRMNFKQRAAQRRFISGSFRQARARFVGIIEKKRPRDPYHIVSRNFFVELRPRGWTEMRTHLGRHAAAFILVTTPGNGID